MQKAIAANSNAATTRRVIGRQAVVIGAGIGGLAAAGALADWFERVIVLERDTLPDQPTPRPGTPQAAHAHGLLVGGLLALGELFPDIRGDFIRAGGVPVRFNADLREEWPEREPTPPRDFGLVSFTMTRPVIEATLRRRVAERANVAFRQNTRASALVADVGGRRVVAVRCRQAEDGADEMLPADIVVDASGRGHLTTALLQAIGQPSPSASTIGIGLGYTTVVMDGAEVTASGWKLALTHAHAPHASRRAVLLPIEGNRFMMTVAGLGDERPPGDWAGLLDYLKTLPTPTIYNAVRQARPLGKPARFGLPESIWRHFERVPAFPDGLIPLGDALCRFNPVYGQGMTVAAKEALLLHRLLDIRAAEREPCAGLGQVFLAAAQPLIETPWMMAAIPDFAFPGTRGERPADLERALRFGDALSRLATRDAAVQQLMVEVWHMLKPRSAYEQPALRERVEAEMRQAAA